MSCLQFFNHKEEFEFLLLPFSFTEKGFCVRGDLCAFDHGNDPLVVDDVNLPGIIPYPPPPVMAPTSLPMPPITEPLPPLRMPSMPPYGQPPPPGVFPMTSKHQWGVFIPSSLGAPKSDTSIFLLVAAVWVLTFRARGCFVCGPIAACFTDLIYFFIFL